MANPDQALATQLRNIEARTGRDLAAIKADVAASGKVKHGEVRSWLIAAYGLGYGDANSLAHFAAGTKRAMAGAATPGDALDEIYAGKKAHLRGVHDALVAAIEPWGAYKVAPKKGYAAFRRKKQFAMLGLQSADRAELGINSKEEAGSRFTALKPGGMCQYAVSLNGPNAIDEELLVFLRRAFGAAA